jgi:hypothetical protein
MAIQVGRCRLGGSTPGDPGFARGTGAGIGPGTGAGTEARSGAGVDAGIDTGFTRRGALGKIGRCGIRWVGS